MSRQILNTACLVVKQGEEGGNAGAAGSAAEKQLTWLDMWRHVLKDGEVCTVLRLALDDSNPQVVLAAAEALGALMGCNDPYIWEAGMASFLESQTFCYHISDAIIRPFHLLGGKDIYAIGRTCVVPITFAFLASIAVSR